MFAVFRKEKRVNWLEAPGLAVVLVVTQIPFVVTIALSFVNWNIKRPDLDPSFNGLDNYRFLFSDGDFYRVIWNTFIITGVSLVVGLALAFLLALAFNRDFRGVAVARSILVMPYFVMEPVIGIVWKTLILSPTFGLNAALSKLFGVDATSFFDSKHALWTIVILCVWQWTPFLFLILLSGLQSMPEEVLEAAKVDGASRLQQIIYFKLPLLKPYFKVAGMFGLINLLKVFGVIFVTTQGGPGVASANLSYYVYRTGFYDWQVGRAAAISVVMVALTLLLVNIVFRFQGDVTKRS
ncbi:MAG: sugar ABC transporter permease [Bifidobacteriaceae bacterium]|jgi:sorbitol/mannitol transport system permease protein|nr:sugar ABC transporter permease [Bifidobacteriaceae bacterium]